jgi:protein-S-isoprenylcysteine O-methyltransferase Ste14
LGLGLSLENWISILVAFIPMLLIRLYRIAIEEKVLIDHFGGEYLDYMKKTKRLIPKVY